MRRIFFMLVLVSCGAPQATAPLSSEPLVTKKPIPTGLVIGNRGYALVHRGSIYLARVDVSLGVNADVIEDFDGTTPNKIGAVYAERSLSIEEVPQPYRSLLGRTIYTTESMSCVGKITEFALELYSEVPDLLYEDVQEGIANISPTILVAKMEAGKRGCSPSQGIASLKPIPIDTFYDGFPYTEQTVIAEQMRPIKPESLLFDPVGPGEVIVSVEEIEDDCSKPETFRLTVYLFRKKGGSWAKTRLFEVNEHDTILYISNTGDGLTIGTETGVYTSGAFESWASSKRRLQPGDPNCRN